MKTKDRAVGFEPTPPVAPCRPGKSLASSEQKPQVSV
jgi:hypothetical protein